MTNPLIVALSDISGLAGVVFYLGSYGLLQSGHLRSDSVIYSVLNLLAASLVLISLTTDFHLASALIQISWIVISLAGLQRIRQVRRRCDDTILHENINRDVIVHGENHDCVRVAIDGRERHRIPADTHFIDLGEPDALPATNLDPGTAKRVAQPMCQAKDVHGAGSRTISSRVHAAIENLPPFWAAFALTLTETVGAGTLALPIAIASVGPLAGVALLAFLGILNLITVTYLAEASARNGSILYGNAFVGRLVSDFLGSSAAFIMRLALFAFCCIVLASYFTGFASTLSAATGIAAPVWVSVICGLGLFLIVSNSLTATLGSALLVGSINILVIIILSVLAFQHASIDNLFSTGYSTAQQGDFEPSRLQLVFGVIMVSYFGHLSVSNCAQRVLRREPDGRSLKRGTAAAMLVAIVIYCFWSVAVGSAIDSERLQAETGTVLVPLAEQLGPHIHVLGILFAVLGLGMSSVHYGLGIVNMSRELLGNTANKKALTSLPACITSGMAVLPVLAVFGYVQWTYFNGSASFTAPLEFLGALVAPVLAGIFPVLLLLASRARGLSVSGAQVSRLTSNPVVFSVVLLISFIGILSQAMHAWQDPLPRTAAIIIAATLLWIIADLCRRGIFRPMVRMDIRHYPDGDYAEVQLAFKGRPVVANMVLKHHDGSLSSLPLDGVIPDFSTIKELMFKRPLRFGRLMQVHAFKIHGGLEAEPLTGIVTTQDREHGERQIVLDALTGITSVSASTKVQRSTATTPEQSSQVAMTR